MPWSKIPFILRNEKQSYDWQIVRENDVIDVVSRQFISNWSRNQLDIGCWYVFVWNIFGMEGGVDINFSSQLFMSYGIEEYLWSYLLRFWPKIFFWEALSKNLWVIGFTVLIQSFDKSIFPIFPVCSTTGLFAFKNSCIRYVHTLGWKKYPDNLPFSLIKWPFLNGCGG